MYPPWAYILHIPGRDASNCFRCTHICISCRAGISNSVDIRTAGPYTPCHCNARSFHSTPSSFELLTKPTDITYTMENKSIAKVSFRSSKALMFHAVSSVEREDGRGGALSQQARVHRCTPEYICTHPVQRERRNTRDGARRAHKRPGGSSKRQLTVNTCLADRTARVYTQYTRRRAIKTLDATKRRGMEEYSLAYIAAESYTESEISPRKKKLRIRVSC